MKSDTPLCPVKCFILFYHFTVPMSVGQGCLPPFSKMFLQLWSTGSDCRMSPPTSHARWPSGSLPHRSWYRPWPGSSRWANCYPRLPPVTYGFRSMSIPAMADRTFGANQTLTWGGVEICGGTIKPIILDLIKSARQKIDQRSFCPQIGKLVDSQFKDLWDWLWEKHLERKSMFHLVEVVWVKSSSLWEPEALAVYHCRGRTSIQSLDKSHIGQEFRTTCTT